MKLTRKWGFLRETEKEASKAGIDKTGLEKYLAVIYPEIPQSEWIHNKTVKGLGKRIRPDYRHEGLKLIIEVDGLPHYRRPKRIKEDYDNQKLYEEAGYKVVRIPYFIQLSNDVVKQMFGREVEERLFDAQIPSMSIQWENTPAYCCATGLRRMAIEFRKYPEQYQVNLRALQEEEDELLSGADMLKAEYERLKE